MKITATVNRGIPVKIKERIAQTIPIEARIILKGLWRQIVPAGI